MIQEIKEHTFFDNYLRKEINVVDLGACRGEFIDEINNNIFLAPIVKQIVIKTYVTYKSAYNKIKKCMLGYIYRKKKSCNSNDLSGTPFSEYKPNIFWL